MPCPSHFTPRQETWYPLYRKRGGPQGQSGWVQKISLPTRIRFPDCPAHSESLYRLRYTGPHNVNNASIYFKCITWPNMCVCVCVIPCSCFSWEAYSFLCTQSQTYFCTHPKCRSLYFVRVIKCFKQWNSSVHINGFEMVFKHDFYAVWYSKTKHSFQSNPLHQLHNHSVKISMLKITFPEKSHTWISHAIKFVV